MLAPDVARPFPNREVINDTLRAVAKIVQMQERRGDGAKKTVLFNGGSVAASNKTAKARVGRGV